MNLLSDYVRIQFSKRCFSRYLDLIITARATILTVVVNTFLKVDKTPNIIYFH